MTVITTEQTLALRSNVNLWISDNFPAERKYISHSRPRVANDAEYQVELHVKNGGSVVSLGELRIDAQGVRLVNSTHAQLRSTLDQVLKELRSHALIQEPQLGDLYEFYLDDGVAGAAKLEDGAVRLLLTDPPYSISKQYICEEQVPRRLRKNGADFIMPKGHFGSWDDDFMAPSEWTDTVLPKVGGWAVIFCAHRQIGDYCDLLENHKFVAVTPMVWHKTNPVPFNHKHKPINAWEAIVIGKRPGTSFQGQVVHNVFLHKSPSPQERIHPTQKPLGLFSEFVGLFSQEGETVLDPFAGSATTVLAGAQAGRKVIAYERDPLLFDKAARRIQSSMGLKLFG